MSESSNAYVHLLLLGKNYTYVHKHTRRNSPWFEHHSTIIDWNHLKNVDKKLPILLTKMIELVKDLLSLIPI